MTNFATSFPILDKNKLKGMILHENRLPADDSHEVSCLICYFLKRGKILNCRLLQIIGGALWVKIVIIFLPINSNMCFGFSKEQSH